MIETILVLTGAVVWILLLLVLVVSIIPLTLYVFAWLLYNLGIFDGIRRKIVTILESYIMLLDRLFPKSITL
jgi:hypothetical protein